MPASVNAIVNAALAEWTHWGKCEWNCISNTKSPTGSFHIDDETAYAQYVINTYLPLFYKKKPIKWPTATVIGNDDYFWSAVTISYIMQKAGFISTEFQFSEAHAKYIIAAVQAQKNNVKTAAYWGYRIDDAKAVPDVGDLVGYARGKKMTKAKALKFFDKTASYSSHTDIVVAKRKGEIDVIGGNVRDSVTKKTLEINAAGQLIDAVHPWFVVMKKR